MPLQARAACPNYEDGWTLRAVNHAVARDELMEFVCCDGQECSDTALLVHFVPEPSGTSMLLAGVVALCVMGRWRR